MLDIPSKLRAKVNRRLKSEYFVWFTTVGGNLAPQPRPVWFLWEPASGSFLIYSQPHARKTQHLLEHPKVALHFNADSTGDNDVLVFIGTAQMDPAAPSANQVQAYIRKYRDGLAALKMTPESFSQDYSTAIRIIPTSFRGW